MLIILFTPLFLVIILSIRIFSPGPILYVQKRIGRNGKIFNMYKFRSMVPDAETKGTGLYSFEDDPRITYVGHYLRRLSLDELPQLFNVLLGSMSLVGPRPPVTYELGPWEDYTPQMLKRFKVKPGITGLAQVSGRNDLNWDEKIFFDNRYVDKYSKYGIFLDILILIKTVFCVVMSRNTIEKLRNGDNLGGNISSIAFKSGQKSKSS